MKQEDKELLLKDLCARLPYGVKVQIPDKYGGHTSTIKNIDVDGYVVDDEGALTEIEWARPYLFPMSSMTEEQKREFDISMDMGYAAAYNAEINCANRMIDFFHKHHIDYRGLIPMGLAIDATNKDIY